MAKDIAVVYMVAGISSRFGGKIKQFAKVGPNGEALIEYSARQAVKSGFNKVIFIVGNKTEKPFKELFGSSFEGIPVFYALQKYDESERDRPWGTSDALCSAKEIINCPFVVCNGDDIYGENAFKILFEHLRKSNEDATLGYKLVDALPEKGGTHRAIFQINDGYAKKLKETFNIVKSDLNATGTKADDLCSMNIFALHPETLNMLNSQLKQFKEEHRGDRKIECLLPDAISALIEEGKIKMRLYKSPDKWLGITNPEDEETVRKVLANKR